MCYRRTSLFPKCWTKMHHISVTARSMQKLKWLGAGQILPFNPASGAGPEACREERQDAGALRGGGEGASRRDRSLDARRPARPGADRRPGVQLRAGERGGIDAGPRTILHTGKTVLLPAAREVRAHHSAQEYVDAYLEAAELGRTGRGRCSEVQTS